MKPVSVVNPYARELTFNDCQTRTRRDHTKYLTMIRKEHGLTQVELAERTGLIQVVVSDYERGRLRLHRAT